MKKLLEATTQFKSVAKLVMPARLDLQLGQRLSGSVLPALGNIESTLNTFVRSGSMKRTHNRRNVCCLIRYLIYCRSLLHAPKELKELCGTEGKRLTGPRGSSGVKDTAPDPAYRCRIRTDFAPARSAVDCHKLPAQICKARNAQSYSCW